MLGLGGEELAHQWRVLLERHLLSRGADIGYNDIGYEHPLQPAA
jgi:hypothetical protein